MKISTKFIAAGVLAFASVGAQAGPITGVISFDLVAEWVDSNGNGPSTIGDAGGVNVVDNEATVETTTGSFTAISSGTVGFFDDFMFAPANTPIDPLWSVTDGGTTFSFSLQSVTEEFQSDNFLSLSGWGWLTGTGFDDTFAKWTFSSDDASSTAFQIDASTSTAAPEPGMIGLLGLGMAAVGFATHRRRKLAA